jgi:tetratricopeptide (TPR) repeat protein
VAGPTTFLGWLLSTVTSVLTNGKRPVSAHLERAPEPTPVTANLDESPLCPEEIVQAIAAFSQPEEPPPVDVRALSNGALLIDENGLPRRFVYTDAVLRESLRTLAILDSGDIGWADRYLALLLRILQHNGIDNHYYHALGTALTRALKRSDLACIRRLFLEAAPSGLPHLAALPADQTHLLGITGIQAGQLAEKSDDTELAKWFYSYAAAVTSEKHAGIEGGAHQSLGVLYAKTGHITEARESLEKASALLDSFGDRENLAGTWMELGLLEMNSGQYETAKTHMRQALDVFEGLSNDPQSLSQCLYNLVEVNLRAGFESPSSNLSMISRALAIVRQQHDNKLEQWLVHQRRRVLLKSPRQEWHW